MFSTINVSMKICCLVVAVKSVHSIDYNDLMKLKGEFLDAVLKCDFETKDETRVEAEHIILHAFSTRSNKSYVWNLLEAVSELKDQSKNSDFNVDDKTYVYIPGLQEGAAYVDWEVMKPFFLQVKNINFFYIDCTKYTTSHGLNLLEGLLEVTRNVYGVGIRIGEFLNEIVNDIGYPLKRIHVFSHSMGTLISARAGKEFKSLSGKQLARITGLEPAGLCFSKASKEDQLTVKDATYVDMYHSNAGYWGSDKFYEGTHILLNGGGGPAQKQCPPVLLLSVLCAHQNMLETFWAKSALYSDKYFAVKCDTLEDGKKGKCDGERTPVGAEHSPGPGFYYLSYSFNFAPQIIPTAAGFFRKGIEGALNIV